MKKTRLAIVVLGVSRLAASAGASPIVTVSAEGLGNANAAEAAFLGGLGSFTTESFEGYTPVDKRVTFVTSVGSFTQIKKGNEIKDCITPPISGCTGLAVLDEDTTPFKGRFAIDGDNWLDSNDSKKMLFEATQPWDSIGFYITDPNDVGADVKLKGFDGSGALIFSESLFDGDDLENGRVYYVTVQYLGGIKSLKFTSDADDHNDGYGIDRFTVGTTETPIPEPGSLFFLGAGLLGLAARRRRSLSA